MPAQKGGNSTSFKKGNTPKSPGRPKLTISQKEIRNATKESLFDSFYKYSQMSMKAVSEIDVEDCSLLDVGIMQSLLKFQETGDIKFIQYPLDHIIGKPEQLVRGTVGIETNETVQEIQKIFDVKLKFYNESSSD
jgi:hypothetical protein